MSKEFENAVLKKLDSLENKLVLFEKSTQERFDFMEKSTNERFNSMEERFNSMEERFNSMEETTQNKFDSMEKSTQEKFDSMEKRTQDRFNSLEKALKNIEIELKDTKEVVMSLNQSFIKFDYEINKKIDTLFDACFVNTEKDTVHEENIDSLNSKVLNHDIRISNLEDQVFAV